jgi:hypothetical protein
MTASRFALSLAFASALLAFASKPSVAAQGDCGQPYTNGAEPTSVDAQYTLRASVGLDSCNRCVCDVNDSGSVTASDALDVLQSAVGLDAPTDCPPCDPDGLDCPLVAQFALFAAMRGACATNADCAAFSTCDLAIHRCRTLTDSDVGWTGLSQNADIDDPIPARLFLDCTGPAPCGQCQIVGHDPSLGDCRCASDNRQVCATVAGPDEQFCGGGQCVCYFGPPMPLSSGNAPVCVLNALSAQPGGEANVDTGVGTIELPLSEKIFLGLSLLQPCPVCVNDTHPGDGVRDGACVGGLNNGATCDAQAYNATFPPPTGALYSLDCFPDPGTNISGGGLPLQINLTTGTTSLSADIPCANAGPGASMDCPCRACSGNGTIPCHSDADCATAGAGTCTSDGGGAGTQPNACTSGVCLDAGNNQGLCQEGPDDTFCDAIVRPDGKGLITCNTNEDCAPSSIGVDGGSCTLVERRPCFLDPIVSQGSPSPYVPLAAATYCSPATSSPSVNNVAGFPGPGRLTVQTLVTLDCKSDIEAHYTPGVGGCPAAP